MLPDGSSIFKKTRSKKQRPFTEEGNRALKAGYDKHGTVWATIVKDPIFQAQTCRSTDLRDQAPLSCSTRARRPSSRASAAHSGPAHHAGERERVRGRGE